MLIVIIVSVAVLGATTAMYVFQPESTVSYKQDTIQDTFLVELASNCPRLG